MTRPVLIAGATGTNGQALIAELLSRSIPVRALVRDIERAKQSIPEEVEIVRGDVSDPNSLAPAFVGVEKTFIALSINPNTVKWFEHYFLAAKAANIKQLVKLSGLGASPDAPSEVIRQHAAADQMLSESGVPYTIIRPNSFFQNMLGQAAGIAQNDQFFLPLADAKQSLIDVRDIAAIVANILTEEGHLEQTYELTGPESLTFKDVAQIIGDVRAKPVTYVPISPEVAAEAMKGQGVPDWLADKLAEIQALFATGAYADVLPDAERLLGRKPRAFADFVRDYASAFGKAA